MALSFDDRLLGEKVNNYCSSSEDEHEHEDSGSEDEEQNGQGAHDPSYSSGPLSQQVAKVSGFLKYHCGIDWTKGCD